MCKMKYPHLQTFDVHTFWLILDPVLVDTLVDQLDTVYKILIIVAQLLYVSNNTAYI